MTPWRGTLPPSPPAVNLNSPDQHQGPGKRWNNQVRGPRTALRNRGQKDAFPSSPLSPSPAPKSSKTRHQEPSEEMPTEQCSSGEQEETQQLAPWQPLKQTHGTKSWPGEVPASVRAEATDTDSRDAGNEGGQVLVSGLERCWRRCWQDGTRWRQG